MSLGMVKSLNRVLVDTNIIVSAIVYGGKPRKVLDGVWQDEYEGIISEILLAELHEVIYKRFPFYKYELRQIEERIKEDFRMVKPRKSIILLRDKDDDRVLEAATTGECDFIVTGDKDLLDIKAYKGIKIVTPTDFLAISGVGE